MKRKNQKIYSYSVFYEAAPDGGYVVLVPALPGCHSQGDTLEEAEKNIKEAIQLYLESLAADKEVIPKEKRSFQGVIQVPAPLSI